MKFTKLIPEHTPGGKLSLKDENIYIPLIFTGLLLLTLVNPILQVVLLEVFRLYSPLASLLGFGFISFFFVTNTILSILALYLFYISKRKPRKITGNILTISFLFPVLISWFSNITYESARMLPHILATQRSGLALISVGLAKQKSDAIDRLSIES